MLIRGKKFVPLLLAGLLALGAAGLLPVPRAPLPPLRVGSLETGDIILVGSDRAFWAAAASPWSTPQHRFGHAGIVVVGRDGRPFVVHAGGSPTSSESPVKTEALDKFLVPIDRVGIYRLNAPPPVRRKIAAAALNFIKEGAVFDSAFTLNSRHRLYCTALVWRAVLEGTRHDIVPVKTSYHGKTIIALSDIERSGQLRQISYNVRH